MALDELMAPPRVVVLRGPATMLREWSQVLGQTYLPSTLILAVSAETAGLPPVLAKPILSGTVNAWVCQGVTCLPSVNKLEMLLEVLEAPKVG